MRRITWKTLKCFNCGKVYKRSLSWITTQKNRNQKRTYCNRKCFSLKSKELRKGQHYSLRTEFQKGQTPWNKNKKWSSTMRVKMNPILAHLHEMNRGRVLKKVSEYKSELAKRIKDSYKWKEWRNAVFERDNFTCQICGKMGGKFDPHHKIPFSELLKKYKIRTVQEAIANPHLWKLNNGQTLCHKPCHKKTKNYGINLFNLRRSKLVTVK